MKTVGRSTDGQRVVVELAWQEVQALLNSAVGEAARMRRLGKKRDAKHLTDWADFALETGNNLEAAWFTSGKSEDNPNAIPF